MSPLDPKFIIDIDLNKLQSTNSFRLFLKYYFGDDTFGMYRQYGPKPEFMKRMTLSERSMACDLIFKNLDADYPILFDALGKLGNDSTVKELHRRIEESDNVALKVLMGSSLWRLNRDPIFIELLDELKESGDVTAKRRRLCVVLDLRDQRFVDYLTDYLDDGDQEVRDEALNWLRLLDTDSTIVDENSKSADYYRDYRKSQKMRKRMVCNLKDFP